jgi:hypothetical protein
MRLAVVSVLVVSLAACGRSEITALRERVAALEKAQELTAQGQEVAQMRKDAAQFPAQALSEVRARSFVLVNENGKPLAELGVTEAGGPAVGTRLRFFDQKGKPVLWLGVDQNGPRFDLHDENGKARAALDLLKDGPELILFDENGKMRAGLTATKYGPGLCLFDENDTMRAGLFVEKSGARLSLGDEKGVSRAVIGNAALQAVSRSPVLNEQYMRGQVEAFQGIPGGGVAIGQSSQPTQSELLNADVTQTAESSVVLFDKKGNVIFRAP